MKNSLYCSSHTFRTDSSTKPLTIIRAGTSSTTHFPFLSRAAFRCFCLCLSLSYQPILPFIFFSIVRLLFVSIYIMIILFENFPYCCLHTWMTESRTKPLSLIGTGASSTTYFPFLSRSAFRCFRCTRSFL